jgi:hypothetical protein
LKANEDIQLKFNKIERRLIRQKRGWKKFIFIIAEAILLSLVNMLDNAVSCYVLWRCEAYLWNILHGCRII